MSGLGLLGLSLAGGMCVVLAAIGWRMVTSTPLVPAAYGAPTQERRRRRTEGTGPASAMFELVGRPFAGVLHRALGEERVDRIRHRIGAAGMTDALPLSTYMRRRAGSAVLLGLLGILLLLEGAALLGVLVIVAGLGWTDLRLWARARKRRDQIERSLPDFLDVLAVTVSAGLGFRRALERVCEHSSGPLAEEFRIALRQMDLGTPRREAFTQLRNRSDAPSLSQLVTAIMQAEELGAPLADALIEIGNDMRHDASQYTRQRAARTAPRIQLAVVGTMGPATLLLLFGAFAVIFKSGGFGVFG